MPQFAEAADRLVRLGYPIFQCQPRSKIPFEITAPNGCKSATDNRSGPSENETTIDKKKHALRFRSDMTDNEKSDAVHKHRSTF
ncbi:MAG: hypothetical protein LBJ67_12490 [Planctomycetaceae bacterium]|jgi:hypothetical protein|nr:hypothetical protein [Planctomycetaceae bacterium]